MLKIINGNFIPILIIMILCYFISLKLKSGITTFLFVISFMAVIASGSLKIYNTVSNIRQEIVVSNIEWNKDIDNSMNVYFGGLENRQIAAKQIRSLTSDYVYNTSTTIDNAYSEMSTFIR